MSNPGRRSQRLVAATLDWFRDSAAQGILTTDAGLVIRSWNHWLELHSGRPASEVVGRELFDVCPELIERGLDRLYREVLTGQIRILAQRLHGYLLAMPPVVEGADSPYMHQTARIGPLVNDGQVVGTITVIDDVTERVGRESELQDQVLALESLRSIGSAILTLDYAECLQRVADLTAALAEAPTAAVVLRDGETLRVHASSDGACPFADLQVANPPSIASRAIRTRESILVSDIRSEQWTPLNPLSRSCAAAPFVVGDEVMGVLLVESPRPSAFSRDDQARITRLAAQAAVAIRQAQLHSALRRSEEWLSTALRSIADGVIASDASGNVTFLNRAAEALTGYSEEEARSKPLESIFRIMDPRSRRAAPSPLAAILSEKSAAFSGQALLVTRDGRELSIDVSGAPLQGENGELVGAIVTFRDMSERRRAEEQLATLLAREQAAREEAETANRLKDEFLATVSHEIRTPLNAMLGWSNMLRSGRLDAAGAERAIEIIERNARSQAQLIEDLLDVSRIITGRLRLEVRAVDLAAVIDGAVESIRPAAAAREIELVVTLDRAIATLYGDANRLQQVVWNLLSNAVKFTPRGGRVEVRLEAVDGSAKVTVRDTGQGISPDFLPHVFDRFRQANASSTRSHAGLGLGLSIVRHLVELHGGTVKADSDGVGQGATFTVMLPRTVQRLRPVEAISRRDHAAPADPGALAGLKIMVVEDELDTREVLAAVLQTHGAEVRCCASAAQAIQDFAHETPDVLVSDIAMPDEDGVSLIRKVRDHETRTARPFVPALALTAYARIEDRARILAAGYQMLITKPVEPAELVTALSDLAGQHARNHVVG
jgi:PAS domain S-box-containing protein